jgi:hypothetical protein
VFTRIAKAVGHVSTHFSGVFAKQNIKSGTFVGIYSGELVKEEEAERRGM